MAAYAAMNTTAFAAPGVNGFAEWRVGPRLRDDAARSGDATLDEARLQLESAAAVKNAQFRVKADLVYDGVAEEGNIEAREINASFSPVRSVDLKIGRQTLTWGAGDYLFINDCF